MIVNGGGNIKICCKASDIPEVSVGGDMFSECPTLAWDLPALTATKAIWRAPKDGTQLWVNPWSLKSDIQTTF